MSLDLNIVGMNILYIIYELRSLINIIRPLVKPFTLNWATVSMSISNSFTKPARQPAVQAAFEYYYIQKHLKYSFSFNIIDISFERYIKDLALDSATMW